MTENTGTITPGSYARVAERLAGWKRPLLVTHRRADGDAIGGLVALRSILRRLGQEPRALLFEPPPPRYEWLAGSDPLEVLAAGNLSSLDGADGVVIVDTCSFAQLEPVADWLRASGLPRMAVDHHVTRDVPADDCLIDETASAACLILLEWAEALEWPLDEDARMGLFVGISTDTGWFRFANTDSRTLAAIARLTNGGIRPADVFERVYQTESAARFRLLGATLGNVELFDDDRLSVMTISPEMFARCGANSTDTDDFINYPLQIGRVNASVLLVEQGDGVIRASFRSKPPGPDRPDVDVAAVAADFGGGGHRRAAGARITGPLEEVKRRVVERMS